MISHVEPLVDAAIASMLSGLNDAIDGINAVNDDFEVPLVTADGYRPGGVAGLSAVWPFVEVSASDQLLTGPALSQVEWDGEATMIVALWCRHANDETLYRSQTRYGAALTQVLLSAGAFGADNVVSRARVAYRRNPETSQTEQLAGFVVVVCQVITLEDTI